jgi:hypothetical protein
VDDLREGRLVSLAVVEGADEKLRAAFRRDGDARPFLRLAARGLDEIADAAAARRAGKPSQSASFSASACVSAKAPLSSTLPTQLV